MKKSSFALVFAASAQLAFAASQPIPTVPGKGAASGATAASTRVDPSLELATMQMLEQRNAAAKSAAQAQRSPDAKPVETIAAKPTAAAAVSVPSQPISSGAAFVNPMTGRMASYEEKEMQLREATLDARIADQRLAVAKSNADLRKLERDSRGGGDFSPKVPDPVRKFAQAAPTAKRATSKKARTTNVPAAAPIAPLAPVESLNLVGILGGDTKTAIITYAGKTYTLASGQRVPGVGTVTAITDSSAFVGGVTLSVAAATSRIALPEPRVETKPGDAYAAVAKPARGVLVPGMSAATTQPVEIGAAVPPTPTQPTAFPADLYKR